MAKQVIILESEEIRAIIAARAGVDITNVELFTNTDDDIETTEAHVSGLAEWPEPAPRTVQHFHFSTGGACPINVSASANLVTVNGRKLEPSS